MLNILESCEGTDKVKVHVQRQCDIGTLSSSFWLNFDETPFSTGRIPDCLLIVPLVLSLHRKQQFSQVWKVSTGRKQSLHLITKDLLRKMVLANIHTPMSVDLSLSTAHLCV